MRSLDRELWLEALGAATASVLRWIAMTLVVVGMLRLLGVDI